MSSEWSRRPFCRPVRRAFARLKWGEEGTVSFSDRIGEGWEGRQGLWKKCIMVGYRLTIGVDVGALVLEVALDRVEVVGRLTQASEVVVTFRRHYH